MECELIDVHVPFETLRHKMNPLYIRLKTAAKNTLGTLMMVMPMLLSVIALAGLFETLVTPEK